MAGIFDRLERILTSYLHEDSEVLFGRPRRSFPESYDYRAAWEELDEYLNARRAEPLRGPSASFRPFSSPPPAADENLRKDYANLEVPFRAGFPEVRRGYKLLLQTYHPDRFATDPEKAHTATEITKKLNESYRRIRFFHETGRMEDE